MSGTIVSFSQLKKLAKDNEPVHSKDVGQGYEKVFLKDRSSYYVVSSPKLMEWLAQFNV